MWHPVGTLVANDAKISTLLHFTYILGGHNVFWRGAWPPQKRRWCVHCVGCATWLRSRWLRPRVRSTVTYRGSWVNGTKWTVLVSALLLQRCASADGTAPCTHTHTHTEREIVLLLMLLCCASVAGSLACGGSWWANVYIHTYIHTYTNGRRCCCIEPSSARQIQGDVNMSCASVTLCYL